MGPGGVSKGDTGRGWWKSFGQRTGSTTLLGIVRGNDSGGPLIDRGIEQDGAEGGGGASLLDLGCGQGRSFCRS